jgi:hypothetical protein
VKYNHPLIYTLGPKPVDILKVKHGVTELSLSNGKMVRLSLHVDGVDLNQEDQLNISYNVIVETMAEPSGPVMEVHESVQ